MRTLGLLSVSLLLGLAMACGGGGSAPPPNGPTSAASLAYTDPGSGTYLLKRNAGLSTPTHLVLELWGPTTTQGSGLTVSLSTDGAKVAWANVNPTDAPGTLVANGTVFDLGSGTPILKARSSGDGLVATVAEKGFAAPKKLGGPLMRVALDLKGTGLAAGSILRLSADGTRSQVLQGDGTLAPLAITVGTLTVQ